MYNIEDMRKITGNAIKSLYQMIMLVNDLTLECHIIDYNSEIRNISESICEFDVFSDKLFVNIHPEDRDDFARFVNPDLFPVSLNSCVYTSLECRIRHIDNQYYWSEITFCNATNEDNVGGHDHVFLIRDIHERKLKELTDDAELRKMFSSLQNKYDELFEENMKDAQTGCYNRKGMKYYTDKLLDEARSTGKYLFVCVADLNGLKHLNDTYGHAAGDEAIAAVSAELHKASPTGSRIIRTGGDEFLLIAALDANSKEPYEMDGKIDEGLARYNAEHPNPFTIGASYGWVLLPIKDGMTDIDEYVAMADEKMYEMKVQRDKYRRD